MQLIAVHQLNCCALARACVWGGRGASLWRHSSSYPIKFETKLARLFRRAPNERNVQERERAQIIEEKSNQFNFKPKHYRRGCLLNTTRSLECEFDLLRRHNTHPTPHRYTGQAMYIGYTYTLTRTTRITRTKREAVQPLPPPSPPERPTAVQGKPVATTGVSRLGSPAHSLPSTPCPSGQRQSYPILQHHSLEKLPSLALHLSNQS